MGYLAFVDVSYDPRELFDMLSRVHATTARKFLPKLEKINDMEGRFLLREDRVMVRPGFAERIIYGKLPVISASVGNELSTIDYLNGTVMHNRDLLGQRIAGCYRILPHAHVTDGKGLVPECAILEFGDI